MKKILSLYFIFIVVLVFGQKRDSVPSFVDDYYLIKDGDSLMIELNEVSVLPKHKFNDRIDIHYYYWFKKKVFKAYPYAILASKRVDSVHSRLERIKSKRKKRQYIKRIQKYLEGELTEPLKKLTRTEGRVLLKLIHRQTGKTAFNNVKELRSGWKAFWYNATANIFNLSLKDEYNPKLNNEDYLIEDVLQRAYIDELLEYQEPKLQMNYLEILANKKGAVDVEKYKKMFAKQRKKREKNKNKKRIK
ncbi:DUF4294 domain-containing protein [Tenacibaculum sp. 190524A02b]|uniref:DUF4294 domain-containing protein n=1 Tax=Tenacibaculum vairaonense TaxID=3137860 RepID=A0ABM9PLY9_9FLAO